MRNRVGAIILKKKKILLVSTDGSWFWTPGGKIEDGESEQAAVQRELKEELLIIPKAVEFYNKYEVLAGEEIAGYAVKGGIETNYIVTIEGSIKPSAEIKFADFYSGSEALNLTMLESFKENVIKSLIKDELL